MEQVSIPFLEPRTFVNGYIDWDEPFRGFEVEEGSGAAAGVD